MSPEPEESLDNAWGLGQLQGLGTQLPQDFSIRPGTRSECLRLFTNTIKGASTSDPGS